MWRRGLLGMGVMAVAVFAGGGALWLLSTTSEPADRALLLRAAALRILDAPSADLRRSAAAEMHRLAVAESEAGGVLEATARMYAVCAAPIARIETDAEVPPVEQVRQIATDDLLVMAELLYKSRRWGPAEQVLQLLLERSERREAILRQAIALRYDLGRDDDVLRHCRELGRLKPDDPYPDVVQMRVHRNHGQWDHFIPVAEQAVAKSDPPDWVLWIELADGYTHVGATQRARKVFDEVADARPDLVEQAPVLHARLLMQEGRIEDAKAIVRRLLDENANDVEALLLRGKLLMAEGDFDGAVRALERARGLSPADEQVLYHLGQAHARLGHRDEGERFLTQHRRLLDAKVELYRLEQIAAQQPQNGEVRWQLAQSYGEIGLDDTAAFWERAALATGYAPPEQEAAISELEAAVQGSAEDLANVVLSLRSEAAGSVVAPPELLFQAGQVLVASGRVSLAAWCWTQAVELAPDEGEYRRELALLHYACGRYDAAHDQLVHLLLHGGLDLIRLPMLGNRELPFADVQRWFETGARLAPPDADALLGLAVKAWREKELDRCEELLHAVLERDDASAAAEVWYARVLYESGQQTELAKFVPAIGVDARSLAEYWVVLGLIERDADHVEEAARCFREALERDPNHYMANDQLGRLLHRLGLEEIAEQLVQRSTVLLEYAATCRQIHADPGLGQEPHFRRAVEQSEALGCVRDAYVWSMVAAEVFPNNEWPRIAFERFARRLPTEPGRWHPATDIRRQIPLEAYPLPSLANQRVEPVVKESASGAIRFAEITDAAGIDFRFEDGGDPATEETRLFEFTGGGVGVLDYDRDGRPDLFFTQGGPAPEFGNPQPGADTERPSDVLYRNRNGESFADVTAAAGVMDDVYSQGVAVGDYDGDGFADLYVANVGRNVLYRNNGDGTFTQQAIPAFEEHVTWTTSAVIADLNGDGWPDIYDVTYVTEPGVHAEMCRSGEASIPCFAEKRLTAEQDRFFLNGGDGTFREATEASGLLAKEGIGLGAVAADFDGDRKLELFVANDARANFLFVNQAPAGGSPLFTDEAVLRGLAYSGQGRAQACMGVAADDANGDGAIDLFVTNFYADYNTLYQQVPGGLFDDRTSAAGLLEVSYDRLGFGTQFLDFNLDGHPDLVLTNGDVVDFSAEEPKRKYRQRPQCLLNRGDGTFAEVTAAGEFFEGEYLGRGLAKLDVNGDGREEFAVSHIGDRAAVLRNETETPHHYLAVELVGTRGNRDAVGTIVTLAKTDVDESRTKQLTAGDGYQASNQRRLVFGLGKTSPPLTMTVRWSSGLDEEFSIANIDRTVMVVEGRGAAAELPPLVETPVGSE